MRIPVFYIVVAVVGEGLVNRRISGLGDDCNPREMQPVIEVSVRDLTVDA